MAFTSTGSGWDGDWSKQSFLNEIVAGLIERQRAVNLSPQGLVAVGDDVQAASFLGGLQNSIYNLLSYFVDHRRGNYSDMDGLPYWQADYPSNDHFIFDAMAAGQVSWRRQVVEGTFATEGSLEAGDIIGPWLFDDLQRALQLLLWISSWGNWGDQTNREHVGYSTDSSDWTTARDSAVTGFTTGPLTGRTFGICAYTQLISAGLGSFAAEMRRAYGTLTAESLPTLACAVDIYFPTLPGNYTFNNNGDMVQMAETGIGKLQKAHYAYNGSGSIALNVGDSSFAQPTWCAEPAVGESSGEGYIIDENAFPIVLHVGDAFVWK